MASLGLHAAIPLTHACSQQLYLVAERDSIRPFFCLYFKTTVMWPKLLSSAAWWCWNMARYSATSSPAFCFQWFPSIPNFDSTGTSTVDHVGLELKLSTCLCQPMLWLNACIITPCSKFFLKFFSQIGSLSGWSLGLRSSPPLIHLAWHFSFFSFFFFIRYFLHLNFKCYPQSPL